MGKILDAFAENELYTTEVIEKWTLKPQSLIEKTLLLCIIAVYFPYLINY